MPQTFASVQRERKGVLRELQRQSRRLLKTVKDLDQKTSRSLSKSRVLDYRDAAELANEFKALQDASDMVYKVLLGFHKMTRI